VNSACGLIEIRGSRVALRDPRPEDVEARIRWVTVEIAWQDWDAPWEGKSIVPPEKIDETRRTMLDNMSKPLPSPRSVLYVQRIGGPLIGRVSYYDHDAVNRVVSVGVGIWESPYWNQGLGTEALRLWLDYVFTNLDVHRISLGTWSGNVRMMRCAQKCGFVLEARFRESRAVPAPSPKEGLQRAGGERYDALGYGLLRREWEAMRGTRR